MKKYLVLSFTSIVVLFAACKKSENDANQFKDDFYTGCMQSIKNSAGKMYNYELSKDYCNCVTKTVLPKLSEQEIKQISDPNNQTVQNKINQLIEPCLQDYLNKTEDLE